MRLFLTLIILALALPTNGQDKPTQKIGKWPGVYTGIPIMAGRTVIDTIPMVEYIKTDSIRLQAAFFINGKVSNPTMVSGVGPLFIDNIHIEKEVIEINGKKYDGQIHLYTKEHNPQWISLTDLVLKYTNLQSRPAIVMINNDIIKDDYEQYLVDEKFILKIIVDAVEWGEEKLDIVRLLTKTKENIEKSQQIRIRGVG